jgi:hypothetical protein
LGLGVYGRLKQVIIPKKYDDDRHGELACGVHHFPPVKPRLILVPKNSVRFEEHRIVTVLSSVQKHTYKHNWNTSSEKNQTEYAVWQNFRSPFLTIAVDLWLHLKGKDIVIGMLQS